MSDVTARLHSVSKRYGSEYAVNQVDLTLHAGERIALVGHNGAGKSTLVKLMLGLVQPSAGAIEVLGVSVGRGRGIAAHAGIGYLPENVVFPPALTAEETMVFYARLKRCPVSGNAGLLERVGLAHAARRRISGYSKGMRQRLGLAQALIGAPQLMLLDEPTTGLDPALRRTFYEILDELAQRGVTVLLSSHALAELEARTDRIVVMNRGHKVADGSLAELRAQANCPTRIRVDFGHGVREFTCDEKDKATVLKRALALPGDLRDVEVASPSLDDLYAHFLRREAAE
jgi:Cu-processing system ATP-binding protein